jgi:putative ABC transport system substrate-binding protein
VRRREFITLLGSAAAAWPVGAKAQPSAMPVIGFLSSASPAGYANLIAAFRDGVNETGLEVGRNVTIEFEWAEGELDRLPRLAADLVRRQVAVIASTGAPATMAAKAATSTIPIAFMTGDDPVKFALVASLARPGGNVTGVSFLTTTLADKRVELLRELIPNADIIAVLANPKSPVGVDDARSVKRAATILGLQVHILDASTSFEFEAAFAELAQRSAKAVLVAADPFFYSRRDQIVGLAARHALPAIYHDREFATAGGLMSYGASVANAYRQVGVYAGKILKGAKPADLPVMQPTNFELVINLQTAKRLGVDVPATLLARADEVFE